jgi:tetratricopeptide (TPR) repeat protein
MSETYPREMRAQALFKTGNDAAHKNNLDYAIQMLREACQLEPGNLTFRQTLRVVERRKFGNNPASVSRLVGARNKPIRLRAKTAKAKGHWAHVLEVCEEAFVHNPWDVAASEDAADAAEKLGLKQLAEWLMESVASQAGDSASFFRHHARVYELNEHWQKAIQCWERVKKIDPNDEEAGRQINSLSANATIARSGLHEAIHKATEGTSGPDSFAPDAEDLKQMALAPEERWRKEIKEDPTRIRAYLELADHLRLKDRLDEAEKVLALGLKNNPGDGVLQTQHAEIQISRIHKRIDMLAKRVQDDPSDSESKAKLDQLTAKLHEYEINEFRRRLAARPDDLNLRFEFGVRLARAGQHDAAIAEFQHARNLPMLKVKSLLEAGKSFEAKGLVKLAERSYNDALKALETSDPEDQETVNALHYQLGRVAESQGNLQAAEEHYNEVAANDYSYRDVAERLRNLNPGS